jgi:hypothetical protein
MAKTTRPTVYVDASLKKVQGTHPFLGIGMYAPTTGHLSAHHLTSEGNNMDTLTINTGEMAAIKIAVAYSAEQPYQPVWEIATDSQTSINIIERDTEVPHLQDFRRIIRNYLQALADRGT